MTLIVHHLHVSQSERIPWLCKELEIDYKLKIYTRAPILAPPEYKALHPMGAAPVIQNGNVTLAESCAYIEYICHKYGNGRLFLKPTHPDYADFLYWWHWVDGSFQPALLRALSGSSSNNPAIAKLITDRYSSALGFLDERVRDNTWLAGTEFTAADVILVFSLTTIRHFYPYSLREYGNIVKYLQRIGERAGYRKAMAKADPNMELLLGPDPPTKD